MNQKVAQLNTPNADLESGVDGPADPIDECDVKTVKRNRSLIALITRKRSISLARLTLVVVLVVGSVWSVATIKSRYFENTIGEVSIDEPPIELVRMDDFSVLKKAVDLLYKRMGEVTPKILTLEQDSTSMNKKLSDLEVDKLEMRETLDDVRRSINNILDKYKRDEKRISLIESKKSIERKVIPIKPTFSIEGLGSWNGSPVLTINHHGTYLMIELGESVDQWQLRSLDVSDGKAEFVHQSGQTVRVNV